MIPVTITIMITTWIDIRAKQVLGASDDSENGFCKPVNAVCCTEKCTNQPQKERILGNSGWIFICCQRFYPSSDYSESDPDDIVWCFHCHYHCGLIYTEVFFIFYSCLIELRCMKGKFGPSLIRTFHIKKIKKKELVDKLLYELTLFQYYCTSNICGLYSFIAWFISVALTQTLWKVISFTVFFIFFKKGLNKPINIKHYNLREKYTFTF